MALFQGRGEEIEAEGVLAAGLDLDLQRRVRVVQRRDQVLRLRDHLPLASVEDLLAGRLDAVDLDAVGAGAGSPGPRDRVGAIDDRGLGAPADLERGEDDVARLERLAFERDLARDRDLGPETIRLAAAGPQAAKGQAQGRGQPGLDINAHRDSRGWDR